MALITDEDGTSTHTGSTVVGPVAGTILVGSNTFFKINNKFVAVEDGTMEIPTHQYNTSPPLFHSHSFSPTTIANSYFFIGGKKILLIGDNYSADATSINSAGSNSFFTVTV